MSKLLEIVSSFIPEEQKADIESKINGEVENIVKARETETRKELSSKYGVNFFEEDVNKAFDTKAFVRKDLFVEKEKSYNDLKETHDNYVKEQEAKASEYETFKKEKNSQIATIELLKKGFNAKRLDGIKSLLNGDDPAEVVANIEKTLPELFLKSKSERTPHSKEEDDKNLTEMEKYFAKRKRVI